MKRLMLALALVAFAPIAAHADDKTQAQEVLTGAANVVLYYTQCAKLTSNAQLPLAARKFLADADAVFTNEAVVQRTVEEAKKIGLSMDKWCRGMKALIEFQVDNDR